jgi:hypothetical protein
MSNFYIKNNEEWRTPTIWVKRNGVWTLVKYGYVKQGGEWKRFYPADGFFEYVGSYGAFVTSISEFKFEVPQGVRNITVTRLAAGGGGGGAGLQTFDECNLYPYLGSGGGGGGFLINHTLIVSPGSILTINVGWGGAPGTGDGQPAVAGGNTTISGAESGNITVTGGAGGVSWYLLGNTPTRQGTGQGGSPNGRAGSSPTTTNFGGAGGASISNPIPGNHYTISGGLPPPSGFYGSGGGGGGGCTSTEEDTYTDGNFGAPGVVTLTW